MAKPRDDIKGDKRFELRSGDTKVPFDIELTICSADGENDGWLPYGTTINSIDTIWTTDRSETTVSGIINGTPSLADGKVEVDLDYPASAGDYILWATINFTVAAEARKKTLKAARIKAH